MHSVQDSIQHVLGPRGRVAGLTSDSIRFNSTNDRNTSISSISTHNLFYMYKADRSISSSSKQSFECAYYTMNVGALQSQYERRKIKSY